MSKKQRNRGNGAALQAAISLAFVVPAAGQPAPNARPQGGQVVAGSASIGTSAAQTTITQSSNRAAIDWRSFDVGAHQSVVFQQPGASSITLNRVTGPDPSAIAGRISANGQLVLTNPSGVMFHAGAQVNAQSLIVSAPGITNQNFMAGRMVFDQTAHPNARITNAGTITVKEAGLAALVAPSVANSGTITAHLGHVVLAGAAAHTLDLYGDGLVSIDITKQVTQAPVGPGGKSVTALVTNSGTIEADGGTIQLTAHAADGLVSTLVEARGRIQANTVGGRTGRIEIAGTGGSVVIEGRVAADGRAPGTTGGSVAIAGSDATIIAPKARVTANGRAGGGTVAVGTTLARARGTGPAPSGTSARTVVAAGARISADATAGGDGGRVTVLSTNSTDVAGAITARGGPTAGNGGTIELSGEIGFRLSGTGDTSAPHGTLGTIVLDPRDLTITTSTPPVPNITPTPGTDPNIGYAQGGTTNDAYVTPEQIQNLTGNVRLQATRDLVVASNVTYGNAEGGVGSGGNLTLEAGRNLTVNSGVTITVPGLRGTSGRVPGEVTLTAAASTVPGYDPGGTLTLLGNVDTSSLKLGAGTGGIVLGGALNTEYVLGANLIDATTISTTGPVTQNTGSSLQTGNLIGTAASLSLTATGNQIAAIGGLSPSLTGETASGTSSPFTTTAGGVTIVDSVPLTIGSSSAGIARTGIGVPSGQAISVQVDSLALLSGGATNPAVSAPAGTVTLEPLTAGRGIVLTSSTAKPTNQLALTTAETGLIAASTLRLSGATSNVTFGQVSDAPVDLSTTATFGQLLLATGGAVTQNAALSLKSLSNAGSAVNLANVTLQNAGNAIPAIGSLVVNGSLSFNTGGALTISGAVSANGTMSLASSGDMTVLAGATVSGPNGASLAVDTAGSGALIVAGSVTSNRGTQFSAGTGGITLSGTVDPGQALQIASAGPLVQTGGGILGGTLAGYATDVSLPSRSNRIGAVSGFAVSSGDFLLVDGAALQVYAPGNRTNNVGISVPNGRSVSLVADSLQMLPQQQSSQSVTGGLAISAPGGTLVVAPYTSGGGILLTSGTRPASGLSITRMDLTQVRTSRLQLGGAGGSTAVPVAGAITIGQTGDAAIDLGSVSITRLTLNASGAVTQNAGLGVTTLAGSAASLSLPNAGNFITELNGLTATAGDLSLHTSSGLTISSPVAAPGNLTLSSEAVIANRTDGVGLLLAADVTGSVVNLNTEYAYSSIESYGANGVLQTAGVLTAGTLTGYARTLRLPQTNQITNLGDFTTSGELTLSNGRPLVITGVVDSTFISTGPVTFTAPGITQTATSSITAPELDGSSTANTVLNSRRNAIGAMGTFSQTSGDFTLVTSSPELDFGRNTGVVSATTGSLTFVADRVGIVTQPASTTSISASAGLITFSPFTAGRQISLGDVAPSASNALSLSTSFRSYLHGDTLALGQAGYAGTILLGGANEAIDLSAFRALQVQTTGAVTQTVGSVLTVSSVNGSAGSISLPGNNNVGSLGLGVGGTGVGLAAVSGALAFTTTGNLSLYGPVSGSTAVTLTTGTTGALTVVGSLTAPAVTLRVGGAVSQSSAASVISADTLSITAASAALPGTANRIGTLTGAVAGDLALTDSVALDISGGSTIGGTLSLTVAGAVTGGPLTAQALTGSATSVSLTATGNRIASLGRFTSTGGFSLVDGTALTVAGPVSDPTAITLDVSGALTLAGAISGAPGTVTLRSSGSISQTGGAITAGTLTGRATSAALTAAGNQIASLGPFDSTAGFSLVDATALTVVRAVTDPTAISLTAGGNLTLADSLTSAQGVVTLASSGTITQTGGAITAATLIANATGSAILGQAGNRIATLTSAVMGNLTLTDATGVALSAGSTVGGTLNLTVAGAITGGSVTAQSLTGSATSLTLTAADNRIASLGPFTTTGGFSLVDATALTVAGAVSDPAVISLTANGNLTLVGALSSPQGTVTLASMGSITQSGGAITAATLSASTPGSVLLGQPGNRISTLTSAVSGNLTLADSTGLTLSAGSVVRGALNLTVAGAVTGGSVTAQSLTGSATSLALSAPGNQIASLGPFTTTGGFSLVDATSLTVAGAVSDPTAIALNVSGSLTLAQALSSAQGTVTLNASGTIVQTGGAITAATLVSGATGSIILGQAGNSIGTLTSAAKGNLTLTDSIGLTILGGSTVGGTLNLTVAGAVTGGSVTAQSLTGSATSLALAATDNRIASLGPFTTTGGFSLVDATSLTVAGAVSDPAAITLTVGGNLTLAGAVSSPQRTVTLNASGTIIQTGGAITAGTLVSGATGSIVLGQAGNSIGTLTSAAKGDLALTDSVGLTISGGSTVGGTLNLTVAGAVTGGSVTAQSLTGSATSLTLSAAGNRIASLGPFTTTGGFTLTDATALTVAGAVSDPTAITLTVGGNLTLAAAVSSPQGTVTLGSSGTITQSGGAITAATLTGNATGAAILGQAGNSVGTLAGFTTGGDFTLVDARSLVVSAPVDPITVSLTVNGDLSLNSSVTGNAVVLDVTGAIVEGPGGRIVANSLTSRSDSAALNGSNLVDALRAVATSTGFSIANGGALTIDGPVRDGKSVTIGAMGPITLAGDLSAPAVSLNATGDIAQTAGALAAADTLTISASGALVQSGGSFAAGTLSGSADRVDLGRAGPAAIGQIAGLAATGQAPGTLTVVDNSPLRISGVMAGRFVSVTAAGSLVLADGAVIRTDGQPSSAQLGGADAVPGSNIAVSPGSDGRATLTQEGTVTVAPLTGSVATLRIDLPMSGGTVALNDLRAGSADIVLSLGSGAATGTLVAGNLTVLGAKGQASLSGTVRGLAGNRAAETAALLPGFDLRYTLNGCAIALVTCSATTGADVPSVFQPEAAIASAIASVIRPDILALDVLDLSVTRDRDDPTLLLPNISDKDY